ncbi:MAG TPA: YfiR family protein [Opitutaceae bacterium]|nr:YfiR family protein [Opitutaceae bacterium]
MLTTFHFPALKQWRVPRGWQRLLLLVFFWWCPLAQAQTDPLLIHRVKAGFLFNFTQFTEWPESALERNAPLRIGVLAKPEVAAVIQAALSGKHVGTHIVEVIVPTREPDWDSLHVLYVTSSSPLSEEELASRLATPALLTVGDAPNFAERLGIIAFFERDGKLRFRINPSKAKDSGLLMSAHLASLAEVVRR